MSKAALADLLGVDPTRLNALTANDDEAAVLAAAVQARMAAETAAVDAGLKNALRFVPRPLRGSARKVLFPGGSHE